MNDLSTDSAVIITIGNEILSGKTVDTNAAFIARRLAEIGIRISRVITVGDDKREIQWGVKEACSAAKIVVCTGGLGPTRDDISKHAVADHFGIPLKVDPDQLQIVEQKFRSFGYDEMPKSNISQAEVPEGAVVFANSKGTAPGLLIVDNSTHFFMLPGVPVEMKALMKKEVIPYLEKRLEPGLTVISRTIRTTGIGESKLAELLDSVLGSLKDPEVAYLPDLLAVDVRLTAKGKSKKKLCTIIEKIEKEILKLASHYVYGFDDDTLESVVGTLLIKHGLTIGITESCTGGLVSNRITDSPGSSKYFERGVVTYSDESKIELLGVAPEVIEKKGAVSEETAVQMAEGIKRTSGCDMGLSTTGIAGPTGGTPTKPVGLVYIAISDSFGTSVKKLQFRGDRDRIKKQTAQTALNLIRIRLNDKNLYRD